MQLFEMKKQRAEALHEIEAIRAQGGASGIPAHMQGNYSTLMTKVGELNRQIDAIEANNTLSCGPKGFFPAAQAVQRPWDSMVAGQPPRGFEMPQAQKSYSEDYAKAFFTYVATKGTQIDAALYEGSDGAGGYAVPIVVSDQIVPLAPNEMAVRQLAQVIPTVSDIKIPQQASFGTSAIKTENSAFTEGDPSLSQITLSAFMAGNINTLSWELVQDVPAFQAFAVRDMILAQQMFEENLYVNGTGSGQAQGLIGNVGSGISVDPDSSGNLVCINGILDLIAALKGEYHPNASFLMTRATSIIIRKAQAEANLFYPAYTREGGVDRLFGYPVYFSTSMPAAARGACPVLFGDFKAGYVIGDRGGSGINVKVLDQPLASQGQLQLLTYRRTDGRVRRSEAIQAYNITASGTSSPA